MKKDNKITASGPRPVVRILAQTSHVFKWFRLYSCFACEVGLCVCIPSFLQNVQQATSRLEIWERAQHNCVIEGNAKVGVIWYSSLASVWYTLATLFNIFLYFLFVQQGKRFLGWLCILQLSAHSGPCNPLTTVYVARCCEAPNTFEIQWIYQKKSRTTFVFYSCTRSL